MIGASVNTALVQALSAVRRPGACMPSVGDDLQPGAGACHLDGARRLAS